jgi:DHA3 family macrolide efflux protein-like MFS transporter
MNQQWKKNTILFLASQTISLFGSSLVQYAMTWYITLETQSGAMMTIAILCGFLPTFILSPFAGVWADRYNRKLLIVLSDSFIALVTLILAILFYLGYESVWLLFVAMALRAVGSGIQMPAVNAFLPQWVPEDKLTKVNATNGSIQSLVTLVSPMLSGALLSTATIESIFFIDVGTAAIAVVIMLLFLRVPAHEKSLSRASTTYFSDLKEGFQYILNHSFVRNLCLFNIFFFILAAPVAFLTPLQVTRRFGNDVWRLTAIEIAFSVGMMLGGIAMASWQGFRNKVHTMSLSIFIIGAGTFVLGIMPNFWPYLAFMGIIGVAMPIFHTPVTVLLQQKVEGDFLGRVFGVLTMLSTSMMPLGMLIFGPMADYVAIEWMLVATGTLLILQGLLMFTNKALVREGEPQETPEI